MPVSWQIRCKPPAAQTMRRMLATLPKTSVVQAESPRHRKPMRGLPTIIMPTPSRKRISGRPMPRINSRVGPPPSGSLGMSPIDCTISSSSGTVIAKMSTSGEPRLGRPRARLPEAAAMIGPRRRSSIAAARRPRQSRSAAPPAAGRTEQRAATLRREWPRRRSAPGVSTDKAMARRNRQRQRDRAAFVPLCRLTGDGPQQRREQRKRGGRRRRQCRRPGRDRPRSCRTKATASAFAIDQLCRQPVGRPSWFRRDRQ